MTREEIIQKIKTNVFKGTIKKLINNIFFEHVSSKMSNFALEKDVLYMKPNPQRRVNIPADIRAVRQLLTGCKPATFARPGSAHGFPIKL